MVKAQLQVNDGKWNELKPLLDQLAANSIAEEGCLRFEVLLDVSETSHLVVLHEWRDTTSLERHESSSHVTAFKQHAASLMGRRAPTQVYGVDQVKDLTDFLTKP